MPPISSMLLHLLLSPLFVVLVAAGAVVPVPIVSWHVAAVLPWKMKKKIFFVVGQ